MMHGRMNEWKNNELIQSRYFPLFLRIFCIFSILERWCSKKSLLDVNITYTREEVGEIRISTMPFISDSFLRSTNRFIFSSAFSTTCRDLNGEEIMMI